MCEPTTIMMAAGAAMSAYGSLQQGKAQAAAANYEAQVAQNNARLALENGAVQEQAQRQQMQGLIGQQRAAYAASGVALDSGSALGVIEGTARQGELDALTIRADARQQAQNFRSQATMGRFSARNAKTSGMLGAVGSLLGGATQIADWQAKYGGDKAS